MRYFILLISFCFSLNILSAQNKKFFNQTYAKAKAQFENKDYDDAMHNFKDLTVEHKNNPYTEYAYYWCGFSAYKSRKLSDARFILLQLNQKYPTWEKRDDASYLLANVLLEEQDTVRAQFYFEEIKDPKVKMQAVEMFAYYSHDIPDSLLVFVVDSSSVDTLDNSSLAELQLQLDQDPESVKLAKKIAKKLNKEDASYEERIYLEYLIQDYKLDANKYAKGTFKKSEKKEVYNVSIILPFNFDDRGKLSHRLRFYEMLSGVEFAISDLNKEGKVINYQIFDSKNDTSAVKAILCDSFVKQSDLLFGPVFPKNAEFAAEFALENQVTYVNPLLTSEELVIGNRFTYLQNPVPRQEAIQVHQFMDSTARPEVVIFYGKKVKDSIRAYTYKALTEESGKKVIGLQKVTRENMNQLSDFMEKLKEDHGDSLSHFYVATENDFAGASIMSSLEEFDFNVPVVAPIKWLNIQLIGNDFEPYRRRQVHFVGVHHIDVNNPDVASFRKRLYQKWNAKPVKFEHYSVLGYESALFFCSSLQKYGTVPYEGIQSSGYQFGVLMKGNHFVNQSNTVVPIYKLDENFDLIWVNQELTRDVNNEK